MGAFPGLYIMSLNLFVLGVVMRNRLFKARIPRALLLVKAGYTSNTSALSVNYHAKCKVFEAQNPTGAEVQI